MVRYWKRRIFEIMKSWYEEQWTTVEKCLKEERNALERYQNLVARICTCSLKRPAFQIHMSWMIDIWTHTTCIHMQTLVRWMQRCCNGERASRVYNQFFFCRTHTYIHICSFSSCVVLTQNLHEMNSNAIFCEKQKQLIAYLTSLTFLFIPLLDVRYVWTPLCWSPLCCSLQSCHLWICQTTTGIYACKWTMYTVMYKYVWEHAICFRLHTST